MLFSSRVGTKRLAGLCRRLSTALGAGIDIRRALAREAEGASGHAARANLRTLSETVDRGDTLGEAVAATGDYFPVLLRELVEVGEQTGHLSEIFAQLADHYERQLDLRRSFLATIAWPMFQLGLSLAIVGLLIWVMGVIQQITGTSVDPLGFGLVGNVGLAVYVAVLAVIGTGVALLIRSIQRGLLWTRPIQRAVLKIPALGGALQTLALSRLSWSLYLTTHAGMEIRRALRLSLRTSRHAPFLDQIDAIDAEIEAGNSIIHAFTQAGCFPVEFRDAVAVGEESGRLVESMQHLSRQYHQQAGTALAVLTKIAGVGVWMGVAVLIIALIFRLFGFYLGTINDALQM